MDSRASSAREVAIGYCQGTPLRNEIEARDAARLRHATDAAEEALAALALDRSPGTVQAIVDARYGAGQINVLTDYMGAKPGDEKGLLAELISKVLSTPTSTAGAAS